MAHLSLLEQNVIDRVGSAALCGQEMGLWRTLPSLLLPGNPGWLSVLSEPVAKFSPIQEMAVRVQLDLDH